jgi:hypothetical protein
MKNNPSSKDELVNRKSFLDSVSRGIADADNGRTYSTEEVKAALNAAWDKEIEADSKAGRLDFLIQEALDAKKQGFKGAKRKP